MPTHDKAERDFRLASHGWSSAPTRIINIETNPQSARSAYVEFVSGATCVRMSRDEYRLTVYQALEQSNTKTYEVFDETINGLLQIRDFLGLQLDHAWGNVSDEDFKKRAEPFLAVQESGDPALLSEKLAVLLRLPTVSLDDESVSAIFHCSLDDAQKALESACVRQARLLRHA